MKKTLLVLLVALSILASSLSLEVLAVPGESGQGDDYGNTYSDAFDWVLTLGTNSRDGSIEYSKDIDMFKFTANVAGTYTFSTSNLASSIIYLDIYLYNNSPKLLYNRLGFFNSTVSFQYSLDAGQEYYLMVDGFLGTGTYSITISAPTSKDYTIIYDANGGASAPSQQTNPTYVTDIIPTTPKSYTLSYIVNGGTAISPGSKQVNCTFNNWNTNKMGLGTTYGSGAPFPPNTSAILYAQWNNPAAGELPTPTRSDYYFKGWYTAATGGVPVTPSTIITENTTIYAQWEVQNFYTVTFNSNGGAGIMADQTFVSGVPQSLNANTFYKPGYSFVGWTPTIALGYIYLDQQKISVDSNRTLYAIWDDYGNTFDDAYSWTIKPGTKNSIEGTVDFNGDHDIFKLSVIESGVYYFSAKRVDSSNVSPGLFLYSGALELLISEQYATNLPVYFLYTLTGGQTYYLHLAGNTLTGAYVINISDSPSQDYILNYYANGGAGAPLPQINPTHVTSSTPTTPKSYLISFNTNGGNSITPGSKQVNCIFKNWNTYSSGTGAAYESGALYTPGVSATLYAQWNDPAAGELPTPIRSGYNFKGWYTAATGGVPVTQSTIISGNITIHAIWEALNYTVTFNSNSGTGTMVDQTFIPGVPQTLNANTFYKSGSIFKGWATSPNTPVVYGNQQEITISDNMILYAVWSFEDDYGNTFSDAFDWKLTPGENSRIGNIEYSKDVDMFKFTVGVTGTYTFSTSNLASTIVYLDFYLYSSSQKLLYSRMANYNNATVYFQYSLNAGEEYYLMMDGYSGTGTYLINIFVPTNPDFTIIYDANGGAGAPTQQTNPTHITTSIPITPKSYTISFNTNGGSSITPGSKQVNCIFKNWNTYSSGTGAAYESGALYTPGVSATLYAQWNDPAAGELPAPIRNGYSFKGWYTAATGGVPVTPLTIITDNTTIYAQWENTPVINYYTVTFNSNSGAGSMADQIFTSGVPQTLNTNTFYKSGSIFKGWATTPTAAVTYVDQQIISITGNLSLYAVWSDNNLVDDYGNTFSDAFDWGLTSGVNTKAGKIEYSNDIDMFKFTANTPGVYTFSTSNLSSSIIYLDIYLYNSSHNLLSNRLANYNTTVSFQYALNAGQEYFLKVDGFIGTGTYSINISVPTNPDFVVIYDANGGTGAPAQQINPTHVTASIPAMPKSYTIICDSNGGYGTPGAKSVYCTFKNWNVNSLGSGTSYESGSAYPAGASTTLYAQWNNPAAGELPTPTRLGWYNFKGWYTAATGGTPVTPSTIITGNTTIYAQWEMSNTFSVTFSANGGAGEMADQIFIYGVPQALIANSFYRAGYIFKGWAISPTGAPVYSDQQVLSQVLYSCLYAVWDDYGDTFEEAFNWPLLPGANSRTGTIDYYGNEVHDQDVIKFTATATGTYTISIPNQAPSTGTLELFLTSNSNILNIILMSTYNAPASFECNLVAGQVYYLGLFPYTSIGVIGIGAYTVSIYAPVSTDCILG